MCGKVPLLSPIYHLSGLTIGTGNPLHVLQQLFSLFNTVPHADYFDMRFDDASAQLKAFIDPVL